MRQVILVDRSGPFIASEVEFLPYGWLRAVGHFPHWVWDEITDSGVVDRGERAEYHWPPHRVKEVRGV